MPSRLQSISRGLGYPAGAIPGFNPSHPASRNCRHSIISVPGGNAISLLSGVLGAKRTVFPSFNVLAALGPSCAFNASSGMAPEFTNAAITGATGDGHTIAAIFQLDSTASDSPVLAAGSAGGFWLGYRGGVGLSVRSYGVANYSSGISPSANVPYFYAASLYFDGTNWKHSHVIRRLDTGSLLTSLGNSTAGSATNIGTITLLGSSDAGTGMSGKAAAGVWSFKNISDAELLAWSEDPWSFWYPQDDDYYGGAAAAAAFKAYWANQNNLSVLGTGTV